MSSTQILYHCTRLKISSHTDGYDLCYSCYLNSLVTQLKSQQFVCNGSIKDCAHLNRVVVTMQQHHNDDAYVDIRSTLDDYLHLLHKHDHDLHFEYIANQFVFCDITKCLSYKTHNQNRSKCTNSKLSNVSSEMLDKIHCYFMHSCDIGYRLTSQQRRLINNQLSINQEKNDKHQLIDVHYELKALRKIITNKRHKYCDILPDLFGRNNSKCTQLISTCTNKSKSSDYGTYSFGYELYYGFEVQRNKMNKCLMNGLFIIEVTNKYQSIKEELLSNTISTINIQQFDNELKKAKLYLNSQYCKAAFSQHNEKSILIEH
eukprot:521901_1